jgi:hypothetical protein
LGSRRDSIARRFPAAQPRGATLTVLLVAPAGAGTARIAPNRYVVLFAGTQGAAGFQFTQTRAAALAAVKAAGGTVTRDLSRQIGLVVMHAPVHGSPAS